MDAGRPEIGDIIIVLDEEVPSRREGVDDVLIRLMQSVRKLDCAAEHSQEIELALAEALANAIIHGNREDPEKSVHVWAACVRGEQFVIAITDQGEGFDVSEVPDPTTGENIYSTHGRGIFLMNRLMDKAEHRMGGRQVVLTKQVGQPEEG